MKILVIGATGLLAKPLIRQFDLTGFQLRLFSRSVEKSMFERDFEIVKGDVFNMENLDVATRGCDAVHISISTNNEGPAVKNIVEASGKNGIKMISIVSGCTVAEENKWFSLIENKYQAERAIIESGITYFIFRPTWFFESLGLMVRNGKAMMLGKQPHPSHWVAADDFARMVVTAYAKPEARNRIFYIFGPEQFLMKDLLERYCRHRYPEIKKVSAIPIWMLKAMSSMTGNKELKDAAHLFSYFEKTGEQGNPEETNLLLGKPEITFEKWISLMH